MELIQRLLSVAHEKQLLKGDNGAVVDDVHGNLSDCIPIDPSLGIFPPPLIDAFLRFTASSSGNADTAATGDNYDHEPSPSLFAHPTISSTTSSPKLLPIQQLSYPLISKGQDTVLFSPTGTGKSLAFILPLAARLLEWKTDGSLHHKKEAQRQHYMKRARTTNHNGNDSLSSSSQQVDMAAPLILIVEPSRELARQVGKIWSKFHPSSMLSKGGGSSSSKRHVVTVYGGVPMTRHAALLGSKTDVVIGSELPSSFRIHYSSSGNMVSFLIIPALSIF